MLHTTQVHCITRTLRHFVLRPFTVCGFPISTQFVPNTSKYGSKTHLPSLYLYRIYIKWMKCYITNLDLSFAINRLKSIFTQCVSEISYLLTVVVCLFIWLIAAKS